MKITRHAAPDMRQALRAVREQLGPDAVILSSRRTGTGVEVTAAMDFDAESVIAEAEQAPPAVQVQAPVPAPPPPVEPILTTGERAETDSPNVLAMQTELKTLRHVLETQLARLAWSDLARRSPIQTEMLRELTEVGLAADIAADIVAPVPASSDLTQARRLSIAAIAQRLIVTGDRWLHEGGRIALVGPTGAGKSTTIAKLAVRWVLNHGPRDLALVAADAQRFGAQGELQSLGQLLGVPVHHIGDSTELPEVLTRLSRRRCVLIDTAGVSPRDGQLAARLAALSAAGSAVEVALVIAASTQAGALAEMVARFAPVNPVTCVLTKVDEAASLGGTLSMLMRTRLPISYVCEGQRVPEDLRPARALELVSSAVQLARDAGAHADEDLLERRFGELAHALR